MGIISKIIMFIIVSLVYTIGANAATTDTAPTETAKLDAVSTDVITRENETITSLSPDGKYRAEAYGTVTNITTGGLYPYEGIRISDVERNEVIWEIKGVGYTVSFIWSPDGKYLGIYHTGRTWGESIIVDIESEKQISLPELDEIASHYDESVKPQENRPDPYFKICGWEDSETVIVDFCWTKADGDKFNGQYTLNVRTHEVVYK